MKKQIIILLTLSILAACTNTVSGSDINSHPDGSINTLYITVQDNKDLYKVLDTSSKNEISDQVYRSLLNTITYIDNLTHLYGIEWAKNTNYPDEYVKPEIIDALCVGNLFLEKYHEFGSETYGYINRYEDMYNLSMSYQPLYRKILEESMQLSKKAGMENAISFDCLK